MISSIKLTLISFEKLLYVDLIKVLINNLIIYLSL